MKPAPHIPPLQTSGDVYRLVQSLSTVERNLVRKVWGRAGAKRQPLHVQLFEVIAECGVEDDLAARSALKLHSGAQFSNLKQHLIGELLDALMLHLRTKSVVAQLRFGLIQLQLLIDRSQTGLARRLCKKLLATADASGQYSMALELLQVKAQLTEQHSFRQFAAETEAIAAQTEQYTAYLLTAQSIQRHTDKLALLRAADQLRVNEAEDDAAQKVMEGLSLLNAGAKATPYLSLSYFAAIAATYYMLQAFADCTVACRDGLGLLEDYPALSGALPEAFLSIASTSFYNEFAAGNVKQASSWLERFDRLAPAADCALHFQKRWAIIRFNTTLKIAHKTADYERVAQLVYRDSVEIMGLVARLLPTAEGLSVFASQCISLFVLERYAEAEEVMLDIKERNRTLERQDLFYFTLVFHLVILYERKNWYRLDTATQAAYHVLYNRKQLRPFEKELMSFLKALPAKRGKGGAAEFIRAFLAKLDVYRADPVQRLYFLYFNYYDWLQSKLAGVSYREYKRRLLADT